MADAALRPDGAQLATTQTTALAQVSNRREHDLLGEADVPAGAYWGIAELDALLLRIEAMTAPSRAKPPPPRTRPAGPSC